MNLIANVPELCGGLDVFGLCASWLLVGLILGCIGLWLSRMWQRLGEQGRQLDTDNPRPVFIVSRPSRVSVVRLVPHAPNGGSDG